MIIKRYSIISFFFFFYPCRHIQSMEMEALATTTTFGISSSCMLNNYVVVQVAAIKDLLE